MARNRSGFGVRARVPGRAWARARLVLHRPCGGEDSRMRRLLLALTTFALVAPAGAFARGDFDPTTEFEQHEWVPIHIGPLDLSITKAVVYLMLGSVLTMAFGIVFMRWRLKVEPDTRQTFGEQVYDVAETQIAEQGLPSKAISRWFPYVASLFLFILVVNLIGFIPI